jgi:hypothetical protein
MSGFRDWYSRNQDAITWFLIGWLTFAGLDQLGKGNLGWAALDFGLAYFNYKMNSVRL